ncbi:PREDICTED: uncharacterized protein LOC109192007 [Ipomoea nil]|uniref:uncharacterized protein LOC109192007 n=1 Tax=Ipomoea nil TaxID=35883 RepID=UPI0009010596|nr:PREDICTED: uncharacterized protein LOC109192007 [Ipomoea nil]
MEEVRVAVFQMHPDKSPGPDGFGPGFFQYFWDIVGGEVTAFCRCFLDSAKLPGGANDTLVVLIPKKARPESMKDLRPIALCNVIYKIVAKVCANRLKPLLQKLISNAQSAFVPGRLITDNIMLAYEVHHYLKRKTQGREGVVALKLDMSKAYDRVEWEFLRAVMLKMGFGDRWVNIMLETVTSVHYHILHDQRRLGPIIPGRGLHQGDPLFPYLFLFVAEGLSAMTERSMVAGRLHDVSVARGAPSVSHLLFADDSFLFLRADEEESVQMRYVLDTYARASGQHVNYDKSAACFSANVPQSRRNEVVDVLGVEEGETSGKYLGLPSLVGRRKNAILGFLKDRILTRVRSWNAKFLSRAGREVLLKNVLQAMPAYAMMVFLLPLGLCREIEVVLNQYWWSGDVSNGRGIRWRSWEGLSRPKACGGMGFRRLHEMNKSLLGKKAWREGSNPSYIWRGMLAVKECLKEGCRRVIGDGNGTIIGRDPWLSVDENPFVETELHQTIYQAPVSSLMNLHVFVSLVISGFGNGSRKERIRLNLVISSSLWCLQVIALGQVFGVCMSLQRQVQESAMHLFVQCGEAVRLWNKLEMSHVSAYDGNNLGDWLFWALGTLDLCSKPKFVMACWGVWTSRNESVWKGIDFDLCTMLHRALLFLDCWGNANQKLPADVAHSDSHVVVGWARPSHGRLKLNTDAALNVEDNAMGFGWVLRDDVGNFLAAKNIRMPGLCAVREADVLFIREALSWLRDTGLGAVDVETDCQVVFNAITSVSFISVFGYLVYDVKNLASEIDDVKFCHVKRSANCAAHTVAREASSMSGCGEWLDEPPAFLVNILHSDLMN